ncbi:MAG: hypothetical protein WA705_05170 [Candidatus Ozemobacteraceae bacterium]
MKLPVDIAGKIDGLFLEADRKEATALVSTATLHDGNPAGPRCQRCAVIASSGSLKLLIYYIDLLKIDYRDVIVAGEYGPRDGDLVRVRNLNEPFPV